MFQCIVDTFAQKTMGGPVPQAMSWLVTRCNAVLERSASNGGENTCSTLVKPGFLEESSDSREKVSTNAELNLCKSTGLNEIKVLAYLFKTTQPTLAGNTRAVIILYPTTDEQFFTSVCANRSI